MSEYTPEKARQHRDEPHTYLLGDGIHYTPEHPEYESSDDHLWGWIAEQEQAQFAELYAQEAADEKELREVADAEINTDSHPWLWDSSIPASELLPLSSQLTDEADVDEWEAQL